MRKKFFILFLTVTICGLLISGGVYFSNDKATYAVEPPAQEATTLKKVANIDIKEIPKSTNDSVDNSSNPYISEKQAIAASNAYSGDLYKTAKIKAQINLLTDDSMDIGALSPEAINSDPLFKVKNKISDIPVWIISYQGISLERHNTTFTEQVVFVDAVSGKILYSLRYR